jgi:choline dehydrogenase
MMTSKKYDVLIVGAGSSGCALAARLSEDPERSVLVLESGSLYETVEKLPHELRSAASQGANIPGHPDSWSFVGRLTNDLTYPITRGRVVGGSSAVNGVYFIRGTPEDFDSWADARNSEWSFGKVLPYFVRLESDRDYQGMYHGSLGPVPISRTSADMYPAVVSAFVEDCIERGFPMDPDKNAPGALGVGPIPQNRVGGTRINMCIAYLQNCLGRSNLTLVANSTVLRVIFDRAQAVGVETLESDTLKKYYASEVVLCAGGIKTPHLLLLSGIGPADDLRKHQIPVIDDLPGVGHGFMDHPAISVGYRAANSGPLQEGVPHIQVGLNYNSNSSSTCGDLQIMPSSTSQNAALFGGQSGAAVVRAVVRGLARPGPTIESIRGLSVRQLAREIRQGSDYRLRCGLQLPESRGSLGLISGDSRVPPSLDFRYLTERRDVERLRESVRLSVDILNGRGFRKLGARVTSPGNADVSSDAALDRWVRAHISTAYHLSCSCRMGSDSDQGAVVDQFCRVRGVEHLRVVDTSIMPTIVRRGPNATAVMIGERAAAFF